MKLRRVRLSSAENSNPIKLANCVATHAQNHQSTYMKLSPLSYNSTTLHCVNLFQDVILYYQILTFKTMPKIVSLVVVEKLDYNS